MSVVPDHDLRAGAVVREKGDERVVHCFHFSQLIEHAPDLAIHAGDHGGMQGHLVCLKAALAFGEGVPGKRAIDLVRPENGKRFWKMVGWPKVSLGRREAGDVQPVASPLAFPAFLADHLPAGVVAVGIAREVLGKRVEGKVRGGEGEVVKEGFFGKLPGVFLKAGDGVIRDGDGAVVVGTGATGGKGRSSR